MKLGVCWAQVVQWPGPTRGRPDESNSSSEDQTAYEHSQSHHSHQSREGNPASPTTLCQRRVVVRPHRLHTASEMADHSRLPRTA